MILVDSSVWIDYFRGVDSPHTEKLDQLLGTTDLAVGDIILTEVLQGFKIERQFNEALELFDALHFVGIGGYSLAVDAARNFRRLRSKGYTVRKTVDVLIATRCIVSKIQLLHNDRDFLPFQKHLGLQSVM